ncbi:MAG: FHA domain-containing protein [Nitriliruptoraceae bacterium]|nr:FHA domain-containing protein [Nitriliruptoraceae bacterium]
MSAEQPPQLAVGLRFDAAEAAADEPAVPQQDPPAEGAGEAAGPVVTGDHSPRPAILPTPRAVRPARPAAEAEARRLLAAAGLEARTITVVTVTTQDGRCHVLTPQAPLVVGRDPASADVVVADTSVSRAHCRVVLTGTGAPVVEDLASANGTWIHRGERRLDCDAGRPVTLEAGDWLRSGPHVALVYLAVDERTETRAPR